MASKTASKNKDRAQTGVGAVYAVTFTILVVSGVLTFGYVYVTTPAISASDTTTEAATLGDYLATDQFATDVTTTRSASGPRVDPTAVENFFIDGNTGPVTTHRVIQNNDLYWNVSLVNVDASGNSSIFDGERRIAVGDTPEIGGVSTYRTPVLLEGDIVMIEVRTWE